MRGGTGGVGMARPAQQAAAAVRVLFSGGAGTPGGVAAANAWLDSFALAPEAWEVRAPYDASSRSPRPLLPPSLRLPPFWSPEGPAMRP